MLPWTTHRDMMAAYRADPDGFWLAAARRIAWTRHPEGAATRRADGWHDWFAGGWLNSCYNAVDRHVDAGHGEREALIWHGAADGACETLTYAALRARVAGFAGGLRDLGVRTGDRVLISMPSLPETVIAMLACARLGAIHVVVFGGYAARELAARIDDTAPVVVIAATCGFQGRTMVPHMPLLEQALALAVHRPSACVLVRRAACPVGLRPGRDHDFHALERHAPADPVAVRAEDPLYILHTSGTTGAPKGVVRDNGGHAVALALSMELIYGMAPGQVFFTTSDLGWVVGHSYAVYGPLLAGCTSLFAEGPLEARAILPLCARHRVRVLFTTPTSLRLLRRQAGDGPLSGGPDLAAVFVAGERSDPELLAWAGRALGRPVLDHWWQTETGWSIAGPSLGLRDADLTARPGPGFDLQAREGELILRLPLPPGCLSGVWRGADFPDRYLDATRHYYRTFDVGALGADGMVRLTARLDDVIKVAGRRIASGQLEDVIAAHPMVGECAVVGVPSGLRGEIPVAYVVPSVPVATPGLGADLVDLVRRQIGPFTGLRDVVFVGSLPRTRSGKIVRRALRDRSSRDVATQAIPTA
ncbi:acetyl-CoA synthetase [Gluconacetobacter johannae DSM 13595]|uniref:AMP-binding protein n=1 Tax=Gluconacetobacter johannae TaxID=112140 RepID=A0A7W4J5X2_9PROT|nr:AMP-binding protein [Gluconacetobacter johannae]MBB2175310.1 AMP-binding protein [Gluconacetobacter johannae]GBQ81030.1 acetyl-CoA synthetase [Gluconacetobacter johannae DSM 13595]